MVLRHPLLEPVLKSMVLSVNLDYVAVDSETVLGERDEVAFIPPISGG